MMSLKIVFSSARTLPNSFYREPCRFLLQSPCQIGANYLPIKELVDTIEKVLCQGLGYL